MVVVKGKEGMFPTPLHLKLSISANQMSLTSGFGDAQPMFIFRKISATSSNHMLRSVSSLDIPLVIKAGCSTIPLLAKLASVNELNLMRGTSHVYLVVDKAQSLFCTSSTTNSLYSIQFNFTISWITTTLR